MKGSDKDTKRRNRGRKKLPKYYVFTSVLLFSSLLCCFLLLTRPLVRSSTTSFRMFIAKKRTKGRRRLLCAFGAKNQQTLRALQQTKFMRDKEREREIEQESAWKKKEVKEQQINNTIYVELFCLTFSSFLLFDRLLQRSVNSKANEKQSVNRIRFRFRRERRRRRWESIQDSLKYTQNMFIRQQFIQALCFEFLLESARVL